MVEAIVQLGSPPHPSIAQVDHEWLSGAVGENVTHVELSSEGKRYGVLRVIDSGRRTRNSIFVDPRAWLSDVPSTGAAVNLIPVDEGAYKAWRHKHTTLRRRLFWVSLSCTLMAGLIEVSWNVGKYWDWVHPGDALGGASQLAKWVLVAIGAGGIAAFKDFRTIE